MIKTKNEESHGREALFAFKRRYTVGTKAF